MSPAEKQHSTVTREGSSSHVIIVVNEMKVKVAMWKLKMGYLTVLCLSPLPLLFRLVFSSCRLISLLVTLLPGRAASQNTRASKWGYSSVVMCGLLIAGAPLVTEHRL